jgi:hypothetical protein
MARVGHVWVDLGLLILHLGNVGTRGRGERGTYASVGSVCSAALLGGLVDLDVLDDQVAGVEALGVCVGFGVLEETEEKLGALDWPSSAGDSELLSCDLSTSSFPRIHKWHNGPCAALPVPPAYLLMGTASLCSWTFSRNLIARPSFQPLGYS